MKKTIIVVVCIAAVLGIGLVVFLLAGRGTGSPTSASNTSSLPSIGTTGTGSQAEPLITDALPANMPQGDTLVLQGATGGVTVNNFYKDAKGYWQEMDAVVLAQATAYTIWYYRSDSSFVIDMGEGATGSDQKGAEDSLARMLGVSGRDFCNLSIYATIVEDKVTGAREPVSLDMCQAGAFQ